MNLLAVVVIAGVSLCSCSNNDEIIDTENKEKVKEEFYITLNVSPNSVGETRGSTTTEGGSTDLTLEGTEPETTLVSANLYFCVNNKIIASFASDYIAPMDGSNTSIRINLNERISQLEELAGKEVQVYVVGNTKYGSNASDIVYTPIFDANNDMKTATFQMPNGVYSYPISDFGSNGQIVPLVNAKEFKITIKQEAGQAALDAIKAMFDRQTQTISWWYLEDDDHETVLKLERGVARLEYRGKIDENTGEADSGDSGSISYRENHIYQVGNMNVYAELVSLTPFNVNKESYLFRHTTLGSTTAATTSTSSLFGNERGTGDGYNWVASSWWEKNNQAFWNKLTINEHSYSIADNSAGTINKDNLVARAITETLSKENDGTYKGGYHPWCYVSENTLSSVDQMKDEEVAKYATGVAFKFKVLYDGQHAVTPTTPESSLPLEMRWSTEPGKDGHLEIMDGDTGYWVDLAPEEDGFYLTYIACIVHNNDKSYRSPEIAPMFYGIVRNNTYQISISRILGLPLPNDPRTMFLELDINVLNWQRREVNYEF